MPISFLSMGSGCPTLTFAYSGYTPLSDSLLWRMMLPTRWRPGQWGALPAGCGMERAISQRHPVLTVVVAVILAVLVAPSLGAQDREFRGQVIGVSDGDTITVQSGRQTVKVRLAGIDCPEKRQAFGARAKQFTSRQAFGVTVTVLPVDVDRYGRLVGEVILPNGDSLNRTLVAAGFAWWYRRYSDDEDLAQLEEDARRAKRGLWADPDPIPPWEFRRLVRQRR